MKFELWDFQREAVDALRKNLKDGVKRQVLCSPTGSGKTECAIHIIESAAEKGSRAYFVCDRQSLVNQTSSRFWDNDISHGVAMGSQSTNVHHNILVCSAQTLEKWEFLMRDHPPDLFVLDECHAIRAKIMEFIIKHNMVAIGLSATPFTPGLANYYSVIVNVTTTTRLIRDKYLAGIRIVASEKEADVSGLSVGSNGEWKRDELSERVMRIVGDMVGEWERHTRRCFDGPVPTIVFCPSVADSEAAAELFQRAGYDFRVVHYKQTSEQKQKIINDYKIGKHLGLISCVALTRGFDAPLTKCMIDASGVRRSLALQLQKYGRVMRQYPGKDYALVIDMIGNYLGWQSAIHAFYDAGCDQLNQRKHSKAKRREIKDRDDFICKECRAVIPPGAEECPSCGHKRKRRRGRLQNVRGTLEEVAVIDGAGRKLPYDGDWWEELCKHASMLTADEDQARRIALASYRSIFGRWPKRQFVYLRAHPNRLVANYARAQYRRYRKKQQSQQRHAV